jgi:thiamine-phosphate diphosphorylase
VIINDRVDVAIAAGADGVHVGQSDIPARLVRQMIGPDKILGISVKTPAEAAKAQVGVNYVMFCICLDVFELLIVTLLCGR